MIVTVHEAKTSLSKLLERAEQGEEIIIARKDVPAARLVPIEKRKSNRRPGALKGQFTVGASFFKPLPEEELEAWE